MYPQELFAYHKRPFWPVLCLKRIGIPCCTFVTTIVICSLQIILLSNYSATYNFSTCRHYLTKNYLSFPFAPRWVQHSYLLKRATIDPLYLWVIIHPTAVVLLQSLIFLLQPPKLAPAGLPTPSSCGWLCRRQAIPLPTCTSCYFPATSASPCSRPVNTRTPLSVGIHCCGFAGSGSFPS